MARFNSPFSNEHLLLNKYKKLTQIIPQSDAHLEIKALLRSSLKAFYRYYWPQINPKSYVDNWHIDALCEHMTAIHKGEIKRLIINIPPRCSKTGICSLVFVPWVWSQDPSKKFIYGSQDLGLATELSRQCRGLLINDAYKNLFNVQLQSDAANKKLFVNTQLGHRLTVSTNSSVTGFGADHLVADDPNDINHIGSEASRNDTIRWISNAAITRVEDKNTSLTILQQRGDAWDASGYFLSLNDSSLVHLNLPMEYDETRRCVTTFGNKTWHDPRTTPNELLWPELWDRPFIDHVKLSLGELNYATQFQQLPGSAIGGIFKKDAWHWHFPKGKTELIYILQSWDTALVDTPGACYSVNTVWGIIEDQYQVRKAILLNLWKGKVEYPDLRHLAQRMYNNYRDTTINYDVPIPFSHMVCNKVLIEEKVSGFSLVSDMRRAGINAEGFNPNKYGSKVARARNAAALIQGGAVLLPSRHQTEIAPTPYADQLINECSRYTGEDGDSNDVVDSLSQALIYMNEFGWIYNQHDPYTGKIELVNPHKDQHVNY